MVGRRVTRSSFCRRSIGKSAVKTIVALLSNADTDANQEPVIAICDQAIDSNHTLDILIALFSAKQD